MTPAALLSISRDTEEVGWGCYTRHTHHYRHPDHYPHQTTTVQQNQVLRLDAHNWYWNYMG